MLIIPFLSKVDDILHQNYAQYHYSYTYAKNSLFRSRNMPPDWSLCRPAIIVWAVGSEGDMLPENIGLPLGNNDGRPTYFMMETHYDNPEILSGEV